MNEQLAEWIVRVRECIRHGWKEDCPICNRTNSAKPKPKPEAEE